MENEGSEISRGRSPRPVKVLHVITGLGTGGAEAMLYRLVSTIEGDEFSNSVVSLMDEGTYGPLLRDMRVHVSCLGLGPARPEAAALLRLRRAVSRSEPDVILAWMYHANVAASLAALGRHGRVPVIWGIRRSLAAIEKEGRSTRLALSAGKLFSFLPRRIVYNSRAAARQHEAFGYPAAKTVVIPNGFDTERFRPDPELRARVRAELGIGEATPVVGIVGRYNPAKDYGNFLEAARTVSREYPEACFLLVGRETDTAPDLLRRITDLDLSGRMRALGERRDIPAIMCGLDTLVSSSRTEGFPNTVGEAMSSGVPCVATDVGDSAWIVAGTGKVVPPGSSTALARAIGELLAAGAEGRAALGRAARQRIVSDLSLAEAGKRYKRLLRAARGG